MSDEYVYGQWHVFHWANNAQPANYGMHDFFLLLFAETFHNKVARLYQKKTYSSGQFTAF